MRDFSVFCREIPPVEDAGTHNADLALTEEPFLHDQCTADSNKE